MEIWESKDREFEILNPFSCLETIFTKHDESNIISSLTFSSDIGFHDLSKSIILVKYTFISKSE